MLEVKGSSEIVIANFTSCGEKMAFCKSCVVSNLLTVLLFTDHSFLGFEWQKRWCALSKTVFYYYGSDKGSIDLCLHHFPLHQFATIFLQSEQGQNGERTKKFSEL